MLSRIFSLVVKEFIHLRRDWWLPAFMLIGGSLELLLVGWATSRPITNLPLMVMDQDKSAASRLVIHSLENTGTFALQQEVRDQGTIEQALARGKVNAAIIIPPGFGDAMRSSDGKPTMAVLLNGSETVAANAAWRAVEGVAAELNQRIVLNRLGLPKNAFAGFDPSLRVWFNEGLSEAFYTTPAELGLMLEFTVLLFAALAISRERELGTLEQLLVMPFSSLELIAGKAIPVALIGMADFLIMLGMVHFAFGVPIRGSFLLLFGLAFVYLLVELGKGLVISVVARTQHQAFLIVLVVGMVDFLFTGYAAPVESMPKALQLMANLIPAHHWLNILRGILLKGSGLSVLWPNVAALIVLGLVIGTFSIRYVRRALT